MEFVQSGGTLIPPNNFGLVEKGVYRSGLPNELNFPFLERLGLRKIIYLGGEELPLQLLNFIDDREIELLKLGMEDTRSPWKPVSEEVVITALDNILDEANHPLYITCNLGRHRTGTVIGCLRRMQKWSLTSVFEEYIRHAESKVRLLNEQFIELFDTDLVRVPANSPKWL